MKIATEYMHTIRVRDEEDRMLPVECPITLEYRFQRYDPERTIILTPLYDRYLFTLGEYQYTLTREQTRTALSHEDWRSAVGTYPKRNLAVDEEIYDRIDGLIPGGVKPWPVENRITDKFLPSTFLNEMEAEDQAGYNDAFDIEGGAFLYEEREFVTNKLRSQAFDRHHQELVKLAKEQAR